MTDQTYAPPSRDPADDQTLTGVLRLALQKWLHNNIDDMLPAQVVAYNRRLNRAQVQPLISGLTTNNKIIKRAPIASVPVVNLGGGLSMVSFNLIPGNLGWIKANDRDISLFKQTYLSSLPNTKRKHRFSDAVFIPDVMTGYTIKDEDLANAVFQTINASQRISLFQDKIKITATRTSIGDTEGYMPAATAILDLQSTTKAFKLPVMTTTQKTAIASPQAGYAVYDSTEGGISVYNGTVWS